MSVYLPGPASSHAEENETIHNSGHPENNICLYGRVVRGIGDGGGAVSGTVGLGLHGGSFGRDAPGCGQGPSWAKREGGLGTPGMASIIGAVKPKEAAEIGAIVEKEVGKEVENYHEIQWDYYLYTGHYSRSVLRSTPNCDRSGSTGRHDDQNYLF